MNCARIFSRISLVFLLKMRPYFAHIFTKMSPYEELGILHALLGPHSSGEGPHLVPYSTKNWILIGSPFWPQYIIIIRMMQGLWCDSIVSRESIAQHFVQYHDHVWNIPLLVIYSMAQKKSRRQNALFLHHHLSYDLTMFKWCCSGDFSKSLLWFHISFHMVLSDKLSGVKCGVRDYLGSCSCCRTSLPLVRHFVRRPSHHKSLGSRLESMGDLDLHRTLFHRQVLFLKKGKWMIARTWNFWNFRILCGSLVLRNLIKVLNKVRDLVIVFFLHVIGSLHGTTDAGAPNIAGEPLKVGQRFSTELVQNARQHFCDLWWGNVSKFGLLKSFWCNTCDQIIKVARMNSENAYVCSLRDRSQQKYWLQGLPAPEPAIFHSFAILFQIDPRILPWGCWSEWLCHHPWSCSPPQCREYCSLGIMVWLWRLVTIVMSIGYVYWPNISGMKFWTYPDNQW